MAAYASSATIKSPTIEKLMVFGSLAMVRGLVTVSNYNSTLAEVTAITKFFKDNPLVILGGVSSIGYIGHWVDASKSIKCWNFNYDAADGPAQEAANDTNIGVFPFIAIGRV